MVNIRQHDVAAPVLDAAAEEQFAKAWGTYQKLVDNDYVFHREVYRHWAEHHCKCHHDENPMGV